MKYFVKQHEMSVFTNVREKSQSASNMAAFKTSQRSDTPWIFVLFIDSWNSHCVSNHIGKPVQHYWSSVCDLGERYLWKIVSDFQYISFIPPEQNLKRKQTSYNKHVLADWLTLIDLIWFQMILF